MDKHDIVFLFPRTEFLNNFSLHHGVSYIEAYCRKQGYITAQFNPNYPAKLHDVMEFIRTHHPRYVGLTCYDNTYFYVKTISEEIKKEFPDVFIVVGGVTPSLVDEFIMNDCPKIDYCIRGFAEIPVAQLIKGVQSEKIKGLTFRKEGKTIRNESQNYSEFKENGLDILPSPILTGLPCMSHEVIINTSRGCFFDCAYCCCGEFIKNKVLFFSMDRVMGELKELDKISKKLVKEGGYKLNVMIMDDTFGIDLKRAKDILKKIIHYDFMLDFFAATRFDCVDNELLELMKKAGFEIELGLESVSKKSLKLISKTSRGQSSAYGNCSCRESEFLRKAEQTIKKCNELEIKYHVNIIVGIPGEDINDLRRTVEFLKDNNTQEIAPSQFTLFGNTRIYHTREKIGIELEENPFILPFKVKVKNGIDDPDRLCKLDFNRIIHEESIEMPQIFLNSNMLESDDPGQCFVLSTCDIDTEIIEYIRSKIIVDGIVIFSHQGEVICSENLALKLIRSKIPIRRYVHIGKTQKPLHDLRYFLKEVPVKSITDKEFIRDLEIPNDIVTQVRLTSPELARDVIEKYEESDDDPDNQIYLEDDCKFFGECCMLKKAKTIIGDKKQIKFCNSSDWIGNITDSDKKIDERLMSLKKNLDQRGCDSCSVKKNCPKCLFPKPLTVKQYCELMKDYLEGMPTFD